MTQKPLIVCVPPDWLDLPKVQEWVKAGHMVMVGVGAEMPQPELVIGPRCWNLSTSLLDHYGDMAIKWAQETTYGVANKKAPARPAPARKSKSPRARSAKAKGAGEQVGSGPQADPATDSGGDSQGS